MDHNVFNNDFDYSRLFNSSAMNKGVVRGRWNASVWKNAAHREAFLRGEPGVEPLLTNAFDNGVTDVGIHYVLDTSFRGTAAITTWYALLMDNASYTGVAAADTMASHSGWIENVDYDESVRQTLSFAAASSRAISDSVSFTMNATVTIKGLGVNSDNTKSGTTGTLFSTALFGTPPALVSGNVLTANYSLSD